MRLSRRRRWWAGGRRRIVRSVGDAESVLESVESVLVVDWPGRDVPDTLALAGYRVIVSGGPEPDNYSAYEERDGAVVVRFVGRPPDHVDPVYSHRPLDELPAIVGTAVALGATALWWQSGLMAPAERDPRGCWVSADDSTAARRVVEAAGLRYVDDAYLPDVVRARSA
jgi:predicted CoA-binding protein